MKRFLSTLALVLACGSLGQAHYVILRMNLGAPPPNQPPDKPGVIGQPNIPGALGPGGVRPIIPVHPQPGKPPPGYMRPPPPGGTVSIITLIEYHKQYPVTDPVTKVPKPDRIIIDHAWGRTQIAFDQKAIQVYPLMDDGFKGKKVPRPTVGQV